MIHLHVCIATLGVCFACTAHAAASMTLAQREDELFKLLDLDHAGLRAVKTAEAAGDRDAARNALVEYYKTRQQPTWPIDRARRPKPPRINASTGPADKTLRREFTFVGRTTTLPQEIDWDANPLHDVEWTVCLNQHGFWPGLGRAYWDTHDEKYAIDFVQQLRSWLAAYPRLDWRPNRRYVWRSTLRAGIRMRGPWLDAFCYFQDSPHFTPTDRCAMLHSIAQHMEYLARSRSGGNWLLFESSGLFRMSVMFPEFRGAARWRAVAIERMHRELTRQVYSDGAQMELTPHYHGGCMGSYYVVLQEARKYGLELPDDFQALLEKMFDYALYLAKPDDRIPMLNDSDHDSYLAWFARGAELFGREDMRYRATHGARGTPPKHTSYAFPYAGFYVMRSGWDRDARYLLLEAGPYGMGHQHEDKLQIDLHAYGRSLLLDPGRFTYVGGPWRSYFRGTHSHCTIVVDGRGQDRRATNRRLWVVQEPNDNVWVSNDALDYAAGSYSDGYGPGANVVHVRQVLFVKPDYWIVSDRLYDADAATSHGFASQFQFRDPGATVDDAQVAQSHNEDANLLIVPATAGKYRVDVTEGQTDPPRGWIGWSYHRNHKTPASMVTYRWRGACPEGADMVLFPYPGTERPTVEVKRLDAHGPDVTALEVRHPKGVDCILLQHRPPQPVDLTPRVKTDATVALLRYDHEGTLVTWSAVDGSAAGEAPALMADAPAQAGDLLAKPLEVGAINEHTVKVAWECRQPVRVTVQYGHGLGGGYLFEKSSPEPAARGAIKLRYLTPLMPYVFRATCVAEDGRRVLLGAGTFEPTPPPMTTFDDPTDAGQWQGWGRMGIVPEGRDGGMCLKGSAGPTADVRYISVSRPFARRVTRLSRFAFDYRTVAEHPGKSYYFKVNVTDDQGEDWSAYLERGPSGKWRRVELPLTRLRQDTRNHKNRAASLPAGATLRMLRFTQRKDKAADAGEQAFWIDNVRVYEAD